VADGPIDGAEIRRLRTSFDPPWTATQLAFHLGVSQRTLARWETEGPDIAYSDAMRLARLLGVSVAQLATTEFAAELRALVPIAERQPA
jgi:transcriptional regulator with XRE-family HTH domain